jgi:hypothetical protein
LAGNATATGEQAAAADEPRTPAKQIGRSISRGSRLSGIALDRAPADDTLPARVKALLDRKAKKVARYKTPDFIDFTAGLRPV